jgi:hypothetical protein
MKVLLCPKSAVSFSPGDFLPLTISKRHFQTVADLFGIPMSFLHVLQGQMSAAILVSSSHGRQGFILQSRPSYSNHFSLAITYDVNSSQTFALVHGLSESEISTVIAWIPTIKQAYWLPGLLPIFLIRQKAQQTREALVMCYEVLRRVEGRVGFDAQALYHGGGNKTVRSLERISDVDLDMVTQDITSVSCEVARSDLQCEIALSMLDVVEKANMKWVRLQNGTVPPLAGILETKFSEVRAYFHSIRSEARYYSSRAEAQRQTVYSLIAQKDNRLNIQTTKASLRIAELSRQDSIAMKTIAEATARDSAAMLVISAVTVVFLPATFTATFFSTSFFNFQAGGKAQVVSKWIWIYVVITIGLTLLIIGIWISFSRRKALGIAKAIASYSSRGNLEEHTNSSTLPELESHDLVATRSKKST